MERPYFGHLLFDNADSDARDHAAAERSMSSCSLRSVLAKSTLEFTPYHRFQRQYMHIS